jgi:hypothetical protein
MRQKKPPAAAGGITAGSAPPGFSFGRRPTTSSVRQAGPSLRPAASQHFAPVRGSHALPEPVLLFTVQLLRLISSEHIKTLLSGSGLHFCRDFRILCGLKSNRL